MNHCRDCNSDYATPGTCNCFAFGGKRHASPQPVYVPYVPYVQPYPFGYPQSPGYWGTTITGGSVTADMGMMFNTQSSAATTATYAKPAASHFTGGIT